MGEEVRSVTRARSIGTSLSHATNKTRMNNRIDQIYIDNQIYELVNECLVA